MSLRCSPTADGVGDLLIARVIQGLSTGAALGAIGAGMLDIDRERGALANAMSPGLGTGSGALLSALFVRYLPAPTHLVYLALIGVIAVQAAGVARLRETVTRSAFRPPRWCLMFGCPSRCAARCWPRRPCCSRSGRWPACTARSARRWCRADRLGQRGARRRLAYRADGDGGDLGVPAAQGAARAVMLAGIAALVAGVAITLVALGTGSAWLFFAGTAVSGIGFGSGFQGGIRTVVPVAAPHERAGVLSLLFTVSYLGMGVPAVAAGFLAVHGDGLIGAARDYGAALIVLAALALVALAGPGRRAEVEHAPFLMTGGGTTAQEPPVARGLLFRQVSLER